MTADGPLFLGGPGREILHTERRVLPNGEFAEFTYRQKTERDANDNYYRTWELVSKPATTCGCPVTLSDIYYCYGCGAVACCFHSRTCSRCGKTFCLNCVKQVMVEEHEVTCCKECVFTMEAGMLRKFIRYLLGV